MRSDFFVHCGLFNVVTTILADTFCDRGDKSSKPNTPMKQRPLFFTAFLLILLSSCDADQRTGADYLPGSHAESIADSTTVISPESANAEGVISLNDPSRKIIKTAELRCRVGDVYAATTQIEQLTTAIGGQISSSQIQAEKAETKTIPYSSDSLQRMETYTTTAMITLRIPVAQLDTVLHVIASNADFVDSRSLQLDDATLRFMGNKLKQDAMARHDAAKRSATIARKSDELVAAGMYTDSRNDVLIDRRIENMELNDQVAYATLRVGLYQPTRISRSIVPDMDRLMKPGFSHQAGAALDTGWQLLRGLFIALITIWPLLLISAGALLAWRFRYRRS